MRTIALSFFAVIALSAPALSQIPAGPGQQPGTLPPAPPVVAPPPLVAPPPVPSVVTPLPSPRYGVPPGVTRPPAYSSGGTVRYSYPPPKKKQRRNLRKYRGS